MPHHRLGAVHRNFSGVVPEDLIDGNTLRFIPKRGGCGVPVDKAYIITVQPCSFESECHCPTGPLALRIRSNEIVGIAAESDSRNLCIDMGPSFLCMLELLETQYTGPFPQNEAVPVLIEWAAGGFRWLCKLTKGEWHVRETLDVADGGKRVAGLVAGT